MKKTPDQNNATCHFCDGSGWIYDKKTDKVRRCECYLKKHRELLNKNANIPERYRHCLLDNFQVSSNSKTKKTAEIHSPSRAWDFARKFVEKYPDVSKGYFFYGTPGVGKTHLAVGIISELTLKKGVPCLFYDFQELMMEIRRTYDSNTKNTEGTILAPVVETEILLLDDLGGMKVTDWARDMLGYIINKRYSEKKITLFTSNWMDSPHTPEETLSDRIGTRLRSRLYEMCQDVSVQGEDFRKKKSPQKRSTK